MFYNARWYDPTLGRFTSADTIIPGGAQGLDRYAYVNNSPINYIDPTGHMQTDVDNGRGCDTPSECGKGKPKRTPPPSHGWTPPADTKSPSRHGLNGNPTTVVDRLINGFNSVNWGLTLPEEPLYLVENPFYSFNVNAQMAASINNGQDITYNLSLNGLTTLRGQLPPNQGLSVNVAMNSLPTATFGITHSLLEEKIDGSLILQLA